MDSNVSYSIGMTINLGDFNSAKVEVGVTLPASEDDLDTTYNKAADYCGEKVASEIGKLKSLKGVF